MTYDADAKAAVVAEGIRGHRLAVGSNGNIYATSRARRRGSKLWLITRAGEKRVVDADLKRAAGVALDCRPAVPLRQPTAASTRSTAI